MVEINWWHTIIIKWLNKLRQIRNYCNRLQPKINSGKKVEFLSLLFTTSIISSDLMPRKKKIELPIRLVVLEEENYHIIIESVFPNGEKGIWIVDTGASRSVFDRNLAQFYEPITLENTEIHSAGIGDSQIEALPAFIPSINFGDLHLNDFMVALIDLEHVNTIYSKFSDFKVIGLVGSDFLVKYKAEINYKKLILKVQQ